ncbi:hypothetical protein HanIR_Chr06g0271671 [Helianthus annuus]|nr:hypothetical protein HanIR_Chr06g0271671 [Helianthus annuus]
MNSPQPSTAWSPMKTISPPQPHVHSQKSWKHMNVDTIQWKSFMQFNCCQSSHRTSFIHKVWI